MIPILEKRVTDIIEALIKNGIQFFGTGGALGFDALAAECVLKCRERHPQIRLILVLPCGDQDRMWKEEERIRYAKVKA